MRKTTIAYGICLLVIYGTVAFSSYGYDDEFYNIGLAETLPIKSIVQLTNQGDVHPPGSYVINAVVYDWLGDWRFVRLVSAGLMSVSLVYLLFNVRERFDARVEFLLFVLLGFSPSLLLWCTGLRWYAYFMPIVMWLCVTPQNVRPSWYWGKFFLGMLLLAYIGYAAFIIALPLFLLYFGNKPRDLKSDLGVLLFGTTCSSLLYLPQLLTFFSVHIHNRKEQLEGPVQSVLWYVVGLGANQGVFPLSPAGLASLLGWLLVLTAGYTSTGMRTIASEKYTRAFAVSSILMIVSGLAAKFRNLVLLIPMQMLSVVGQKAALRTRAYLIGISLIGTANLVGCYNVYTHEDTTKSNWNVPVRDVLHVVDQEHSKCADDVIVLTHDTMLSRHLSDARWRVISPYARRIAGVDKATCVLVILTFRGSISEETYGAMIAELNGLDSSPMGMTRLGYDRYYAVKRRIDARVPEYVVAEDHQKPLTLSD